VARIIPLKWKSVKRKFKIFLLIFKCLTRIDVETGVAVSAKHQNACLRRVLVCPHGALLSGNSVFAGKKMYEGESGNMMAIFGCAIYDDGMECKGK